VEGLVYVNGVYLEHHLRVSTGDRPGVCLPPSMLQETNHLVFVSLEPSDGMEAPRIAADADTIRMRRDLFLDFSTSHR
jgi:hypothetical protein